MKEHYPLEFEEWDGTSPFWYHCFAGSLAGILDHILVYPIDTVKTHIQCAACPAKTSSQISPKKSFIHVSEQVKNPCTATLSRMNVSSLPKGIFLSTIEHIISTLTMFVLATTATMGTSNAISIEQSGYGSTIS